MEGATHDGPLIAFFAPDITDVSTIKRAQEFRDNGLSFTVFGFRRSRYNREYQPTWPFIDLGWTEDGRYWHRLLALSIALRHLFSARALLWRVSLYYARNIDQLLLALLARRISCRRVEVIYEVLDLPLALVGNGPTAWALRALERFCLRHVTLLVVSSPGFIRNHYLPVQRFTKPWFLLENKLHRSILDSLPPNRTGGTGKIASRSGYKWVVGYYGLIRGQRTFDLITHLAERLGDQVLFKFGGILTTVDTNKFLRAIEHNKNMVYEGDYVSPRDLECIYTNVDFAWAIDLENSEHNSRWLLPCRFYEAGIYGVPCLTARDFEVGRLVEGLDVGWAFPDPLEESLVSFFQSISASDYADKRTRLARLPVGTFVAGEDVSTLCEHLRGDCVDRVVSLSQSARRAHGAFPTPAIDAKRQYSRLP